MAFVDDPNENSETQVAGAAPLSQSAAPMAEGQENPENTAQQAASQSIGAPQAESQPKGASTGRTAPKASSGMFNNINKYVEKNKPQAQEIATAVSQDFGKKAQEIQQNAAQKQQAQAQALQANQQTLDTNRQFAQNQVNQIMNPTQAPQAEGTEAAQPVIYNPSQQDASRFQDLMKGKVEGVNQVQDLNLSQQNMRAGALQQLANTAETEQGRRNMLGETFRKQGEYTRGMSGLDNLITSGNEQAREGLIQGVQDQAGNLTSGLESMQTEAGQAKMAQDLAISNFGTDISNLSGDQRDILDQQMKDALQAEIAGRAGLQGEYDQSEQSINDYRTAALQRLGDTSDLQNIAGQVLGSGQDLAWRGDSVFNELVNDPTNAYAGSLPSKTDVNGNIIGNSGELRRIDENRFRDAINAINSGYQFGGEGDLGVKDDMFSDMWKDSRSTSKSSSDQIFSKQGIKDSFGKLGQSISDIDAQKILDDNIQRATNGQNLEQFMTGEGLDQYDTAEQVDVDRYNALQKLMGGQDTIGDDRRQTDFVKQDALQALLSKFRSS